MNAYNPVDPGDPKPQTSLPIQTLHGIAGELIVEADLLMRGFWPWRSHYQGAQVYDLLVMDEGKPIRIQCKAMGEVRIEDRTAQGQGRYDRGHQFSLRKGVGAKQGYDPAELDYFALVALDTKQVGYVPVGSLIRGTGMITTLNVRPQDWEKYQAFPVDKEATTANAPDKS